MTKLKTKDKFYASYFGAFELRKGSVGLNQPELRSKQATKLLSILIYHYKDPYPAAKLIDMLWPGTAEDPTHALSNLVYRLRKMLAEFWPGEKLIISRNGSYQWNPDVAIETDVWTVDSCERLAEKSGSSRVRMSALERLVNCYKGRFLEEYSDDFDLLSLQTYYHNLYLKSAAKLIEHYEAEHAYYQMELLCQNAIHIDPLEEQMHCGIMRAYIGTNRFLTAERYYHETIAKMQGYMGGMPTEQMRRIYQQMQKQIHVRETDLDRILTDMAEQEHTRQAFFCEYGFFQKMFVLQIRLKERDKIPVSIVLVSLYIEGEDVPGASVGGAMQKLKEALLSFLRYEDMVTKYSSSQYLLMLSSCTREQTDIVMKRIRIRFYELCKYRRVQLQYSARELTQVAAASF